MLFPSTAKSVVPFLFLVAHLGLILGMPTYELCLVMRAQPRAQLVDSLRRVSAQILESGGLIRRMESLGERLLPQKSLKHGEMHSK